MSRERRRSPRVSIAGGLHGVAVSADTPVKVNDISLGGMAIETSVVLPVGGVHEFRLMLGDGAVVTLRGRIVRCGIHAPAGAPPTYQVGVEFVDGDPAETDEVGELIEKLT